eukprot:ctg_940.g405
MEAVACNRRTLFGRPRGETHYTHRRVRAFAVLRFSGAARTNSSVGGHRWGIVSLSSRPQTTPNMAAVCLACFRGSATSAGARTVARKPPPPKRGAAQVPAQTDAATEERARQVDASNSERERMSPPPPATAAPADPLTARNHPQPPDLFLLLESLLTQELGSVVRQAVLIRLSDDERLASFAQPGERKVQEGVLEGDDLLLTMVDVLQHAANNITAAMLGSTRFGPPTAPPSLSLSDDSCVSPAHPQVWHVAGLRGSDFCVYLLPHLPNTAWCYT